MSQKHCSHNNRPIFRENQFLDDHLFDNSVRKSRKILLFEIKEYDTGLKTPSQI
jgi:hypothetical protein